MDDLDEAIAKLEGFLKEKVTPEVSKMVASYDQSAARIRDMTPEERGRLAVILTESPDNDMTLDEASDWVERMANNP